MYTCIIITKSICKYYPYFLMKHFLNVSNFCKLIKVLLNIMYSNIINYKYINFMIMMYKHLLSHCIYWHVFWREKEKILTNTARDRECRIMFLFKTQYDVYRKLYSVFFIGKHLKTAREKFSSLWWVIIKLSNLLTLL